MKLAVWILSAAALIACARGHAQPASHGGKLERVRIAEGGKGFVLSRSGTAFRPWGVNYGNAGRLMEDYWEAEWQTVADDFQEMKALGYNTVRIHLQFGMFMEAPDRPRPKALERLTRLLQLAERSGLYLDITGLGSYRKVDVPSWYDALPEAERWKTQACFWEAVAAQCTESPAAFCYDLMNEPLVAAERRKPSDWYSGFTLGGYDFLQYVSLDPAGRPRTEVARLWIRQLKAAIRRRDPHTPVTVGQLPWTAKLGHFSGFVPGEVAPEVDFISVHIYPETGKVEEAVTGLKEFAVGKPVVIEETFPLQCPPSDLEAFLRQSRPYACGWIGHYDGHPPEHYDKRRREGTLTAADAVWLAWLELSRKMKDEMLAP